jgi:hypothetical protein
MQMVFQSLQKTRGEYQKYVIWQNGYWYLLDGT